jgi:hypothetical protein
VPRGAPTLVVLRPTGPDYAGLQPEFTIAAYLPPGPATAAAAATAAGKMHGGGGVGGRVGTPATTTAATTTMAAVPPPLLLFPAPTDDGVFLATRPPATTYVLPFGGFARGGVALANAARLALALTRAGTGFRAGAPFSLALYDPPTRWAGRHNEVWVWASDSGWEAGLSGRAGGGGGVATHL